MANASNHLVDLRNRLKQEGSVTLTGPNGARLFLVSSKVLDVKEPGLLIALEGSGALFFSGDRPLNEFRLASAGFSGRITKELAEIVNGIVFSVAERVKTNPERLEIEDKSKGDQP